MGRAEQILDHRTPEGRRVCTEAQGVRGEVLRIVIDGHDCELLGYGLRGSTTFYVTDRGRLEFGPGVPRLDGRPLTVDGSDPDPPPVAGRDERFSRLSDAEYWALMSRQAQQ